MLIISPSDAGEKNTSPLTPFPLPFPPSPPPPSFLSSSLSAPLSYNSLLLLIALQVEHHRALQALGAPLPLRPAPPLAPGRPVRSRTGPAWGRAGWNVRSHVYWCRPLCQQRLACAIKYFRAINLPFTFPWNTRGSTVVHRYNTCSFCRGI